MRVLLLSAYDAPSHRHWHQCLREGLADWDWQLLTLPPRHFSWRVRGNPLHWSIAERAVLERPYDLLLATSMVDIATLRGLVPALAGMPAVMYFHENQFAYPEGRGEHGMLEAQMASLYSALAADLLLFNSDYNRSSFLAGSEELLKRLPDFVPDGIATGLSNKSYILPVPISVPPHAPPVAAPGLDSQGIQVLWNHRWEYDKGPAQLLEIVELLLAGDSVFTLHMVGQQFRERPPEFATLAARLDKAGALGHQGYVENAESYQGLLCACDVVLSTALHDFQGLAVLEACAAGCTPVVPDRLVYPEWFAPEFRYADSRQAVARLANLATLKDRGAALPRADVSAFYGERLLEEYRGLLRSQLKANSVS